MKVRDLIFSLQILLDDEKEAEAFIDSDGNVSVRGGLTSDDLAEGELQILKENKVFEVGKTNGFQQTIPHYWFFELLDASKGE